MTTRARPRDDDDASFALGQQNLALHYDAVFRQLAAEIMRATEACITDKAVRIRISAWMKKLGEPCPVASWKRNRNAHAKLLLEMVQSGHVGAPFDRRPEHGPLGNLPVFTAQNDSSSRSPPRNRRGVDGSPTRRTASQQQNDRRNRHGDGARSYDDGWDDDADYEGDAGGASAEWDGGAVLEGMGSSRPARAHHAPTVRAAEAVVGMARSVRNKSEGIADAGVSRHSHHPQSQSQSHRQRQQQNTEHSTMDFGDLAGGRPEDPSTGHPAADELTRLRDHVRVLELRLAQDHRSLREEYEAAVQRLLDRKEQEVSALRRAAETEAEERASAVARLEARIRELQEDVAVARRVAEQDTERKSAEIMADAEKARLELQRSHAREMEDMAAKTSQRVERAERRLQAQAAQAHERAVGAERALVRAEDEVRHLRDENGRLARDLRDVRESHAHAEQRAAESDALRKRMQEEHAEKLQEVLEMTSGSLNKVRGEYALNAGRAQERIDALEAETARLKGEIVDHVAARKVLAEDSQRQRDTAIRAIDQEWAGKLERLRSECDGEIALLQRRLREVSALADQRDAAAGHEEQRAEAAESALAAAQERSRVLQGHVQAAEETADALRREVAKWRQAAEADKAAVARVEDDGRAARAYDARMRERELARVRADADEAMEDLRGQCERRIGEQAAALRSHAARTEEEARARAARDQATIAGLTKEIETLREDLERADNLRRAETAGLERVQAQERKAERALFDSEVIKLRQQQEDALTALHQQHLRDVQRVQDRAAERVCLAEGDAASAMHKASEAVEERQRIIVALQAELSQTRAQRSREAEEWALRAAREQEGARRQFELTTKALERDLQQQTERADQLERMLRSAEADAFRKISELRQQHEQQVRGLMPVAVQKELEDTIVSLKAQIGALEERSAFLAQQQQQHAHTARAAAHARGFTPVPADASRQHEDASRLGRHHDAPRPHSDVEALYRRLAAKREVA
eukprot:Opistho-2@67297